MSGSPVVLQSPVKGQRGRQTPMKSHTFAEYKEAMKDAGPKLLENLLDRAAEDPGIEFPQFVKLCDLADKLRYGC